MSLQISIHALLAESDNHAPGGPQWIRISIHALLAESDIMRQCAELKLIISIHALLAESDIAQGSIDTDGLRFLSTPSLRRATRPPGHHANTGAVISIHALLAESDLIRNSPLTKSR